MRLGIDFGTTRTVVAVVDRGNYPVVAFGGPDGEMREWFPPLVAICGPRRLYGWQAWAMQGESNWTIIRSIKRYLQDAGPYTIVEAGGQRIPLLQLLREMMSDLRQAILNELRTQPNEPLQVMLGVPANSNGNQRYVTTEAFREAGFQVLGLLNEPSAASIEFGHRTRVGRSKTPGSILVYDLGGGTFDASLVEVGAKSHSVFASEGISTLGGDDFDTILADFALETAGIDEAARDSLTQAEIFRLHEECREKKETLHPNTRRLVIDLEIVRPGWPQVSVLANDFYERCRSLVEETLHAVDDLLASQNAPPNEIIYVTGGASDLPLVARILREVYGRRVQRSPYTRSATAIGLAIQADETTGYVLRDRFLRHFGVWREAEGGRSVVFDPLFKKGTSLPGPSDPPIESRRSYRPVHNIGHFRYLECSHLGDDGRPTGDIMVWDEILFPFDPKLQEGELVKEPVLAGAQPAFGVAEESYACDLAGVVSVTIANRSAGYERTYRLGRWSSNDEAIVPGKKKRPSQKNGSRRQ